MLKVYKLKPDSKDKLLLWGGALMGTLKADALETLKEEGLTHEEMALFQIGEDWYMVGHTEGEGKPANMERAINKAHKDYMKDSIEKPIPHTMAYDLKT